MKKLSVFFVFLLGIGLFSACQKSESEAVAVSDFTGNQTIYALQAGSQYVISGTVVFKERKDGATTVALALKGLTDSDQHPVHLHLGDIATDQAKVAQILTPVAGQTGTSTTIISQLADGTNVAYSDLIKLNACVKVHLASVGDEANIILAAGNIGSASTTGVSSGRIGVAVCASK
jgi:hypothetical protein